MGFKIRKFDYSKNEKLFYTYFTAATAFPCCFFYLGVSLRVGLSAASPRQVFPEK